MGHDQPLPRREPLERNHEPATRSAIGDFHTGLWPDRADPAVAEDLSNLRQAFSLTAANLDFTSNRGNPPAARLPCRSVLSHPATSPFEPGHEHGEIEHARQPAPNHEPAR